MLARAQPGLGEDRVVGGREDLGHAARLRPVERVRDRHRRPLVHHRQLGLAAASDDRHHPVTHVEALRVGAERGHLAGQLEAGDVGRRAGRGGVGAAQLEHVGAVEPGGLDPHEDLAARGLRIRPLLDDELPVLDRHGAHGREIYRANSRRPW